MRRYFQYLYGRMRQLDMRQEDLGRLMGLSAGSISQRFSKRIPWSIDEMYRVLEILREPPEKLHLYFPKDGISMERAEWTGSFEERRRAL